MDARAGRHAIGVTLEGRFANRPQRHILVGIAPAGRGETEGAHLPVEVAAFDAERFGGP